MNPAVLSRKKRIIFVVIMVCIPFVVLETGLRIYRVCTVLSEEKMNFSESSTNSEILQSTPNQPPLKRSKGPMIVTDPILHHVWGTYLEYEDNARSIPYTLYTNGQSWVEKYDVTLKKPKNTFRIFYVGDSNVQGVVSPEYKMVEIVEKKLNLQFEDSGIHFEVINTGTTSYSILSYYLLIKRKLLRYSPDLVMVNIDMNDIVGDYVYRRWAVKGENDEVLAITDIDSATRTKYILTPQGVAGGQKRSSMFQWFVNHSAIAFYLDRASSAIQAYKIARIVSNDNKNEKAKENKSSLEIDESANWLSLEWTESVMENVNKSMQTLSLLIEVLQSEGVKVAITGVPHLPQYQGTWSTSPFKMLSYVAQQNGVPYLDTFGELKKMAKQGKVSKYYWEEDHSHFNIEGNQVWAEIQFKFLVDENYDLLPFSRLSKK